MKLQALECPKCKAPIEPIEDARFMFCPYCGVKIIIDDLAFYKENSKTARTKIRADRDARKSIAEKEANIEIERIRHQYDDSVEETERLRIIAILILSIPLIIGFMVILQKL